jgi:glutamate racemase
MTGERKIGIFDSGVGGLSVLRQLTGLLPEHSIIYLADQAHVPYGPRTLEEVQAFSFEITRWLLMQHCGEIIVACNTASAAALHKLRKAYPNIPFVGMEPAVKPAAEQTHTGVVGVIATPATFQGELYASVVERFASGVTVLEDTCPGLVEQIEAGNLEGDETRRILEKALFPMLEKGIDTIVMGCTHFPFVIPLIQQITGPNVRVIDPAQLSPAGRSCASGNPAATARAIGPFVCIPPAKPPDSKILLEPRSRNLFRPHHQVERGQPFTAILTNDRITLLSKKNRSGIL